jgi:hypothetical protein
MTLHLVVSLLAAAVVIPAQVTPPSAKPKARLEGRVVSSKTGVPLGKARVTLESGIVKRYHAASGKDGTFLFEDVDPGDYSISVERVGYLESDGRELSVEAGERMKDVELKLAPQGVISGRVVDEDGDPVPHAQVTCYRWLGVGAKKHVVDSTTKEVDEEANFTFTALKPGHYYVLALDFYDRSRERQSGKGAEEALATTYYPNAGLVTGATPLNLTTGTELRNLEIRMRKVRVFRIRGRIANTGAGQPWEVYLKRKDSTVFSGAGQSKVHDGDFEFAAVEPGSYFVETSPNLVSWDNRTGEIHTSTAMLFARCAVEVAGQNIDDLALTLMPAVVVTGKVHMDGLKPSKKLRVSLSSSTYMRRAPEAEPAEDGSFSIGPLPPVEFKISVAGLPEGAYVKSIRYGGQEIAGALDLSSLGAGALEIALAPNAATIAGIVRDEKGEPFPHGTVIAWTNDEAYQVASAASDGSFEIKNLAPGDFHIACWEEDVFADVAFRKLFEKQTRRVTLREGWRENVEVPLITKEAIEAAELK